MYNLYLVYDTLHLFTSLLYVQHNADVGPSIVDTRFQHCFGVGGGEVGLLD